MAIQEKEANCCLGLAGAKLNEGFFYPVFHSQHKQEQQEEDVHALAGYVAALRSMHLGSWLAFPASPPHFPMMIRGLANAVRLGLEASPVPTPLHTSATGT